LSAESLTDLLRTLVDIPSVTGQEAAIADFVAGRLGRGAAGECLRSGRSVVWRGPRRGRRLVVLAGHLDTVPPQVDGPARLEGDRVFGLGATDMKGGVAVMLALLETLDPASLRFDLAAVFYDAEEGPYAGNGLGRVLEEMAWLREASLAVLLEPTDARVELGCNGMMNAEVRVRGQSAHAARPWAGVNAIEQAAPWLAEAVRFPVTPTAVQGLEFRETLQVTVLSAGRARNVVPDELVANLNYRYPPDRTAEQAEARLRALVPGDFGFQVVDRAPPGLVCLDLPEVREFVRRFGLETAGKQGWTDVARFSAVGVPAFNFGPGIPELCHAADEYCPVGNLKRTHDCLVGFLAEEDA
jgi:succinyl-diaminopimelate desuccinylase